MTKKSAGFLNTGMSFGVLFTIVGTYVSCIVVGSENSLSLSNVLVAGALYAACKRIAFGVRNFCEYKKFDSTNAIFAQEIVRFFTICYVIHTVMDAFKLKSGVSVSAVIGSLGITLGLASQKVLGSLAAGCMLLLLKPFKVNDTVKVCGVEGTVKEVLLFDTCICTADQVLVRVPNSEIFGKNIENLATNWVMRVTVDIPVPLYDPIPETRKALQAAAEGIWTKTRRALDDALRQQWDEESFSRESILNDKALGDDNPVLSMSDVKSMFQTLLDLIKMVIFGGEWPLDMAEGSKAAASIAHGDAATPAPAGATVPAADGVSAPASGGLPAATSAAEVAPGADAAAKQGKEGADAAAKQVKEGEGGKHGLKTSLDFKPTVVLTTNALTSNTWQVRVWVPIRGCKKQRCRTLADYRAWVAEDCALALAELRKKK